MARVVYAPFSRLILAGRRRVALRAWRLHFTSRRRCGNDDRKTPRRRARRRTATAAARRRRASFVAARRFQRDDRRRAARRLHARTSHNSNSRRRVSKVVSTASLCAPNSRLCRRRARHFRPSAAAGDVRAARRFCACNRWRVGVVA